MAPTIRRADLADAVAVAACLSELGYDVPTALVMEKLAALAASRTDAVFVAEEVLGPSLYGVIGVHVLPLLHAPGNLARITALAVRRDVQRRGVGRALVAAAEAFAWASECQRVEVTSGDHRPSAHAFYQALGYALDARRFMKHASAPEPGGTPRGPRAPAV